MREVAGDRVGALRAASLRGPIRGVTERLAFSGEGPEDTSPFTPALLDAKRRASDDLADAAIAELEAPRAGSLLAAVRAQAASGGACRKLVEQTNAVPSWVDFSRMQRAHRRSFERAVVGGISLLSASLVESFAAARGAKVLVRSGRLLRMPERRLFETARFTFDIAASGGAPPGSAAHDNVVEIRLLHALIRKRLASDSTFDVAAWGRSINQEDYASTLLMFSHVYMRGLERLGTTLLPEEQAGVQHTWRWIGHVMGVCDELLTKNVHEERLLYAAITRRQFAPDDDSRRLTHDLLSAMANKPPFYLSRTALHALSRHLVGDALGDALHLERSPAWTRGISGFSRLAVARDRLEGRVPLGRRVSRILGRSVADRIIRQGLSVPAESWVRA